MSSTPEELVEAILASSTMTEGAKIWQGEGESMTEINRLRWRLYELYPLPLSELRQV